MAEAITDGAFAAALEALGPFEPEPHVALAVSGGADSVALAVLASRWLARRAGRGTVLTVDHGWRAAADAETRWVAELASGLNLEVKRLRCRPSVAPMSQAMARDARYAILDDACRAIGCLHLLVAHHADDQRATIAMRRQRGEGPGLAGMATVRELRHCRVVRPLLAFREAAVRAVALELGRGWIEDPSNRDARYERTRMRNASSDAEPYRRRAVSDRADALWLARHARRERAGGLSVPLVAWYGVERPRAARLLALATAAVGAARHRPSLRRTAPLVRALDAGADAITLAGTIVRRQRGTLVVQPEYDRQKRCGQALASAPFAAHHVASDNSLLIC